MALERIILRTCVHYYPPNTFDSCPSLRFCQARFHQESATARTLGAARESDSASIGYKWQLRRRCPWNQPRRGWPYRARCFELSKSHEEPCRQEQRSISSANCDSSIRKSIPFDLRLPLMHTMSVENYSSTSRSWHSPTYSFPLPPNIPHIVPRLPLLDTHPTTLA